MSSLTLCIGKGLMTAHKQTNVALFRGLFFSTTDNGQTVISNKPATDRQERKKNLKKGKKGEELVTLLPLWKTSPTYSSRSRSIITSSYCHQAGEG